MENVLYIKHKFGILYYQNKLNKFKEKFELKDINDKYYKNNHMIVKVEGRFLVVIINDTNFLEYKNKLNDYFYNWGEFDGIKRDIRKVKHRIYSTWI